jgi:hypothetical protein
MNDETPPPAVVSIGFDSNLAESDNASSPPAADQTQQPDALEPKAVDAVFQNETAAPAETENAELPLWAWAGMIALPLDRQADQQKKAKAPRLQGSREDSSLSE